MKLLIVESPNKVHTISQFLDRKEYLVMASVGHITKVKDSGLYRLGIDVKGDFAIDFEVDEKKKDVVKQLKEAIARCDEVILATDLDREGEAIAWHLKETLKIPEKKYKRVTFDEITKKAVTEALAHPRKINQDLVDAAFGRTALDKIIGYRLSPIARQKVSAKSVGRCQSAALKILVEREEEIKNFVSKKYYEIWLPFTKDKKEYKAQYKGFLKDKKNTPTIEDEQLAKDIVEDCKDAKYKVKNIESSDRVVAPKPPFTTATFQQEVSSRLGYSVKRATTCAQQLFEGINIGGQHQALITYIRTDSTDMAEEFQESLKKHIVDNYGKNYLGALRKAKKQKNAQEAHECLRCIDLSMTPKKLESYIQDQSLLRVYEIIYNRTVASMMSDAIITDTDFTISEGKYKFIYTEHAVKFDGFRKVYSLDDEELAQGLDICVGEQVKNKKLQLLSKETQPPKRYGEATLIKKLTDLSIGRPSTYATIVSTILDPGRGYCEEQGKSLAPTEKGMQLSHFLDEAFPKIINYDYSAQLEEKLDEIATGKTKEVAFLKEFYSDLEAQIKGARGVETEKKPVEEVGKACPECGSPLVYRTGRFGKFIACSNYPKCKHTERIS